MIQWKLSESEAEAEEPTNHKAWNRALWFLGKEDGKEHSDEHANGKTAKVCFNGCFLSRFFC